MSARLIALAFVALSAALSGCAVTSFDGPNGSGTQIRVLDPVVTHRHGGAGRGYGYGYQGPVYGPGPNDVRRRYAPELLRDREGRPTIYVCQPGVLNMPPAADGWCYS